MGLWEREEEIRYSCRVHVWEYVTARTNGTDITLRVNINQHLKEHDMGAGRWSWEGREKKILQDHLQRHILRSLQFFAFCA